MSIDTAHPFALPDLQADIAREARDVAARYAERHREVRLHPLDHAEPHPELWRDFRDRGWPGLLVPAEHGGSAGGLLALVAVMEALAEANLLLWMPVLTASVGHAIAQVGPQAARERWLERVATGETLFALAVTEPECGHNVFRSRTTVRPADEGGFVVSGLKAVTSGVDLADRVLVFGRAPREAEGGPARFTTVLIDPGAPGVELTEVPMGRREGVRQFELRLDDVHVPADALVGEEGQGLLTLWPITQVERLLTAALAVGNAAYCVSRAAAAARERIVFGTRPIGAEQAIQHPLASLHARVEAVRLVVQRAAARFDAGADLVAAAGDANVAKVLAADLLFDAADRLVQTLGAQAWDEREGVLDLYLDARAARSAPVSQELALNFIAQHGLGLPAHR